MTKENKKGMWLRRNDETKEAKNGWIVTAVSALLSCAMLILITTGLSGFGEIYSIYPMLAAGAVLCIAYAAALIYKKQNLFYMGLLFVLFLMVLVFGKQIIAGAGVFWNQLGNIYVERTGMMLPVLDVTEATQTALMIFSVFAGSVVALITCFVAEKKAVALSIIIPGVLLLGMFWLKQTEMIVWFIPAIIISVLILLCGNWEKRKIKLSALIGWGMVAVVTAIFAAVSLNAGFVESALDYSENYKENQHKEKYETDYSTLPEGDFSGYKADSKSAHPALIVTAEKPETLYLRGFTGAVFENGNWQETDYKTLAENKDLLYWLNVNEFSPAAQFEAAVFEEEIEKNTITVQNIGACSGYYYIPFNLCDGKLLDENNLSTDSIKAEGERVYTFNVVSGGAQKITATLDAVKLSRDEAVLDYRKAESAYRDYVTENYMDVPNEVVEMLGEHWDKTSGRKNPSELAFEHAQICTLEFLKKYFPEEGEKPEIELPLSALEDTSYQYATVAVMTLRYFGIPARYAEGYVVTEEMFDRTEEGNSVRVDSKSAHAWAEVYQEGLGWIPMELTEGMGELLENPDKENSSQSTDENPNPEEGKELEDEPEAPTEEPLPDGGYMTKIKKAFMSSSMVMLIAALLLLIAIIIRREIIIKHKEEKFSDPDTSNAAAWIYGDTAVLLEQLGFRRGNGSMYSLTKDISEKFGEEYAETFNEVTLLNSKAMFSSEKITAEEREKTLEFRTKTIEKIKENIKRSKQIWLKWIRCFY
ncbi:MAG: hypothetical protein J6J15_02430 [Oscillospiraceae bacterium]|nr:hypothetical protein [Oscillospiraceae bacterium]